MSQSLPTKSRCVPCDGRGCDACSHRGWVLAALDMDCPECDGAGELCDRSPRADLGFVCNEGPCHDCSGLGTVERPCSIPGCESPAVRWPENGDPVCEAHDLCDLCDEAPPVPGEQHCTRCARYLAVVASASAA